MLNLHFEKSSTNVCAVGLFCVTLHRFWLPTLYHLGSLSTQIECTNSTDLGTLFWTKTSDLFIQSIGFQGVTPYALRDYLPLKQGLRQASPQGAYNNTTQTPRLSSTKTRIKTLNTFILTVANTACSETIFH